MALPNWTAEGLLPPGVHPGDMSDVYDRMVVDAPQRDHREMLFAALQAYLMLVRRFIPSGKAWIDGGFGTQKGTAPHDVDVVLLPNDWHDLERLDDAAWTDFQGLLTHQDIIIGSFDPPEYWRRIQPIGGALDSFICVPGHEHVWAGTWASVKGDDGSIVDGLEKGFVEVAW